MKNKLLIFSVFILLFYSFTGYSQNTKGTINGTIVDKTSGAPIESADIVLLNAADSSLVKGISSDKEGKFSFTDVPFGKYTVKANLVGYSSMNVKGISLTSDKPSVTLDPIKLKSGDATTEEILVETEKSAIQFSGDKKIFNVGQNPMNQTGSLIELLKNIPSVSVDADGNVSLRGSTNVKITVDGRPFGLEGQNRTTLLEQIPANQIESIELVTNPSSKYEAEGVSGIINIVTKKTKTFGYNGNFSLNAGTGDKYGGGLNLNLKKDNLQFFTNYNYNLTNFTLTGGSDRTNSQSTTANLLTQDYDGSGRVKSHFVKGGIDYFINPLNSLGLTFTYQNSARIRGEKTTTEEFDVSNNLTSQLINNYRGDIKNNTLDLALNHTLKFKDSKQTLTTDAIYSQNNNNEDGYTFQNYVIPSQNPGQVKELSVIHDKDFSLQSDYSHPFSENSKLETGYKIRYRNKENDYTNQKYDYTLNQYVTDVSLTNNFNYKDLVSAVYLQYSGAVGILSYMLGTRVENTSVKSSLITNNTEFKKTYTDFFPSANISAKLGKTTETQISYSRRIRRPGMWELNPFVNSSDPNNYFSGNPDLKPEYTDSYEWNLIQYLPANITLTPSLFYRRTKDLISRTRQFIDSNTTLTSFVNYTSSKSYGAELIFNAQPVQFWNLNGSVSYFKTQVDASNISSAYINEGSTWSGRVSSSLFLPLSFSLQLNYFYSGDIIAAQATVEPFSSFDASLRKDFLDGKLSATIRVSDIFNTLKFRVNINNDSSFKELLERKRDTRIVNLSLSFKFGEADKTPTKRRRDSNRENQGSDGPGF